jgi:hypothetical protein
MEVDPAMSKKDEQEYRDVCLEMSDQTLALASRVIARAVQRGVSYRLACHAVKVAMYQGLFGSVLQAMKNDTEMPSNLKIDKAFSTSKDHEQVAMSMVKLIFDHLQVLDQKHVWRLNIARRELRPGEKLTGGLFGI